MELMNLNFKAIKNNILFRLIPISLSLTAVFASGCSLRKSDNSKQNINNSYLSSTFDEAPSEHGILQSINENKALYNVGSGSYKGTKLPSDKSCLNDFINYINCLDTQYEYERLYDIDTNLNKYYDLTLIKKHNSKLKSLDSSELLNIVIENNKIFKADKKTSLYKDIGSNELKSICNLIICTCKDFIRDNEDIDEDRLLCVLSDLKIFNKTSTNNAAITDDNCLMISPNMLELANKINGDGTETDVLIHEINHLLQKGCNCDAQKNDLIHNYGFSYSFKDSEINSLDFTWIYEASAEKNMCNYTNHEPLVYKNMIGYLESLSLISLVNDNFSVNDTEALSFNRTLDSLYKFFNVSEEKDKKEILNLMYSIEIMQTAPDDFYDKYERFYGRSKDDKLIDEINYCVKSSVCETISKLFYKNLTNAIMNNDVTLEDIFYLISIFECDLNNHLDYSNSSRLNDNKLFFERYVDIQNNFFYYLSKTVNVQQQDIELLYNNYTSKVKDSNDIIANNYSLDWLSNDKLEYLEERQNDLCLMVTYSIRNIFDCYSKKTSDKIKVLI